MDLNRLSKMYEAKNLKRLHALPTLSVHTMAEHVFGAMAVAVELCDDEPKADVGKVLQILLTHDVAEVYTGDVPAHIKKLSPDLAKELGRIELQWMEENRFKPQEASSLEYTIAQAADRLDLAFTMLDERIMGNRSPRNADVFKRVLSYVMDECHIPGVPRMVDELWQLWEEARDV